MPINKEALDEVALSEAEYQLIVEKLGREPTQVELGMFGSLWSEHCGYKHSRALLKLFPTSSKRVLCKAGEENAGAVDIGDGHVVVMKVESHNHPSAIEPFQGAATGVGGIVRDIFTMGAFPIALLNSLRFGPLDEGRNRYLFNGVVGGIASYGNCLGIPDVGGEIYFSPTYSANPLVNAMCVGLAKSGGLVSAVAKGLGNPILLVGADTGRDGLHGASGLASRTFEESRELRSAVQVGNPFLEKLLIEACLELARTDWIIGMQDLGAAGLTSAAVESAHKGGSGIEIDVLKVPRREQGMTPYEVMLSESQERMLVVARLGYEDKVKELFARWDLRCDIIGYVTGDGKARIMEGDKIVADASVDMMANAPSYRMRTQKPTWLKQVQVLDLGQVPDAALDKCEDILLRLLASPTIASKEFVYRQYDHQVQDNSVVTPGGDAAVLRIKGTTKGIALTIDGNSRYCYLDPYVGGAISVAEAARNLVCSGAEPIALTDCLNFGNPERADVYYQLKECIRGMARACRHFKIPVISGNVSLYNETKGESIYPTPVVGMLGLLDDVHKHCTTGFKADGDLVVLLSGDGSWDDHEGLGGSEYLELIHGKVVGRPALDIELEKRVQTCCLEAITEGLARSAHDCSEGGLAVALAECCISGKRGFRGSYLNIKGRKDSSLFGEAQSRIILSVAPKNRAKLERLSQKNRVVLTRLGNVGGKRFSIPGYVNLPLDRIEDAWRSFPGKARS
ncbi:MAG: phosphoribosylformylglycinamidine synthase subunit PurL [Dehalococcoidia bacterium]|nr:phosphoribosylformylglycinamidine synthase subunit PurL [Dehalococcoidia bacterium]